MPDLEHRLTEVLETERAALVDADLAALDPIRRRKEELIAELESHPGTRLSEATRQLCARNQSLIAAALDGSRSAVRRIEELRRVQAQLSTYDSSGRKQTVQSRAGAMVRKA